MPVIKTEKEELKLAKRRMEVARMYLQGKSQIEIAERLSIDHIIVIKDLGLIRKEWLERAGDDYEKRKVEEIAKLNRLEEVAWDAWFRSCEDARILRQRREYVRERVHGRGKQKGFKLIPVGKMSDETTKGQAGDPRFLEQIGWCIEMRMKCMGMLKGDTINQNIMTVDFGSLVGRSVDHDDETERRIAEVKQSVGITSTPKHLELKDTVYTENKPQNSEDTE